MIIVGYAAHPNRSGANFRAGRDDLSGFDPTHETINGISQDFLVETRGWGWCRSSTRGLTAVARHLRRSGSRQVEGDLDNRRRSQSRGSASLCHRRRPRQDWEEVEPAFTESTGDQGSPDADAWTSTREMSKTSVASGGIDRSERRRMPARRNDKRRMPDLHTGDTLIPALNHWPAPSVKANGWPPIEESNCSPLLSSFDASCSHPV